MYVYIHIIELKTYTYTYILYAVYDGRLVPKPFNKLIHLANKIN